MSSQRQTNTDEGSENGSETNHEEECLRTTALAGPPTIKREQGSDSGDRGEEYMWRYDQHLQANAKACEVAAWAGTATTVYDVIVSMHAYDSPEQPCQRLKTFSKIIL